MKAAEQMLASLPQHFEAVAPTLAAANRALTFATKLFNLSRDERMSGQPSSGTTLHRQLVAARVLSQFATEAMRQASTGRVSIQLLTHVLAGVNAAYGCAVLACTMRELEPQSAFAIGAACSVVLGPGAALLVPALQSQPPEMVLELCKAQLGAVMMFATDLLRPSRHPRAAAAFASSTAKPTVLLPWLAALCQAMICLHSGTPLGQRNMMCVGLVALAEMLLSEDCYAQHQAHLARNPALQQPMADALLAVGLGGHASSLG